MRRIYTDPRLLDVRSAVEKLPTLKLPISVAPPVALARYNLGHLGSSTGTDARKNDLELASVGLDVSAYCGNEKAPVTSDDITGALTARWCVRRSLDDLTS
jgi:hypothetical protein